MVLMGLSLFATKAFAQQKTITGKVTSEQGTPLAGVSVIIKGTGTGTTTSSAGNYSIRATVGQVLAFRFIGTAPEERPVGDGSVIDVTLKRCIVSNNVFENGDRFRLHKGTHHLNGKQALEFSRIRENRCAPNETDIQREQHQQALFNDMKSRLLSPSSFLRLPLIAWNAPPAIISDLSGPELMGLFGALAVGGTPPTKVLKPTGAVSLPGGGAGLTVSEAARREAVASFMKG